MNLDDVMRTVIGGLDSTPPPAPTDRARAADRAKTLYDDICSFVAARARQATKPPIVDGLLRSSCIADVLGAMPMIRSMTKRSEFEALFAEFPVVGEQMTYDMGHAIHEWWRESYLGPMGRLWGIWRCHVCGREETGVLTAVHGGLDCHGGRPHEPRFVESYFEDRALRLRGHPDGLLLDPPLVWPDTLLEIKSASSASFDKLSHPEADHVIQVHPYMHGLAVRDAMFVYIDKGKQTEWWWRDGKLRPKGKPRIKVFHQQFDDAKWSEIKTGVAEFFAIYDRLEPT